MGVHSFRNSERMSLTSILRDDMINGLAAQAIYIKETKKMSEQLKKVANELAEKEKLAAIIWLVIGIMQCLSFACIIAGVWNIYAAITRFKQAEAVKNPWPGIVNSYDKWQSNIIISIVINVIFGGVVGAVGGLYDLFVVRDFVLKNKEIFNEAG